MHKNQGAKARTPSSESKVTLIQTLKCQHLWPAEQRKHLGDFNTSPSHTFVQNSCQIHTIYTHQVKLYKLKEGKNEK